MKSICKKLNGVIRRERKRRTIFSQHSWRPSIEHASTTRLHTLRSLLRFESYLAQAVQFKREVFGTLISKPSPRYTNITFRSLFISLLYIIIKNYMYLSLLIREALGTVEPEQFFARNSLDLTNSILMT